MGMGDKIPLPSIVVLGPLEIQILFLDGRAGVDSNININGKSVYIVQ